MKPFSTFLRFIYFVMFSLGAIALPAQDIHFSQFGNSPLNLSPGLNGVFGGDMRFVGNYRSQWRSVPVPYTTFSGSVENKFYYSSGKYDRYFTGSLLLNYDKQGSLDLTSIQIGIPISLTLPLAGNQFLSLAATPSFGQRSFGTNKVTFDGQYFDCFYHPEFISENLTRNSLTYFDLSAGLNFRTQSNTKRSRLDLGGGLHHINRPKHDFWSSGLNNDPGNVRLQRKWSAYGIGVLQVTPNLDLMGQAIYQHQGGYREVVYGIGGRLQLNRERYQELAFQLGVDIRHRYNDAFIPHAEILWKTWMLGLSYDLNIWSDINQLTNRRGGPEVSLTYRLYRTKIFGGKSCQLL